MLLAVLALIAGIHEIPVDEGERLVLIRMSPKGAASPIESDRFHRAAEQVLRSRSRIGVLSSEQAGIDVARLSECELDRRLTCWCEEILRASSTLPEDGRPVFALVVSIIEGQSGLEATSILIDLERVSTILRSRDLSTEDQIFEAVSTSRSRPIAQVDTYFADLFSGLAPAFEGLWSPAGSIRVETDEGMTILLDGTIVGLSSSAATFLSGLAPGLRRVAVRAPDGTELTTEIQVGPGVEATADLRRAPEAPRTTQTIALYGGIAVAAAGVILSSVAIGLAAGPDVVAPCAGPTCVAESEQRFYRSNGVLLLPLGYSLIIAGGFWSLGGVLFDDDSYVWWSLAAGALAGAATYSISALAD